MGRVELLVKPQLVRAKAGLLATLLDPAPPEEKNRPVATKIIATIGPATRDLATVQRMLAAGLAGARFDLSWGTLEYHIGSLELTHKAAVAAGRLCAMCLDVSARQCTVEQPYTLGSSMLPEYEHTIRIAEGQKVLVTSAPDATVVVPEDPSGTVVLPVTQRDFAHHVHVGDELNVGRYLMSQESELYVRLAVTAVTADKVQCTAKGSLVVNGHCTVSVLSRRGGKASLSVPSVPPLSANDLAAMAAFHARGLLDVLVVGDLTTSDEVAFVRDALQRLGAQDTKLLVKLTTAEAVLSFGELAMMADGFVLARGWLGMQVVPEKMAVLQKRLVQCCNMLGKLCVVTRIVDSMTTAPRPTRAEATDIANSVIDGADAFVLGAQTTRGTCPVACVETVSGICRQAEKEFNYEAHYDNISAMFKEHEGEGSMGVSPKWIQSKMRNSDSMFFNQSTSGGTGMTPAASRSDLAVAYEAPPQSTTPPRMSSLSTVTFGASLDPSHAQAEAPGNAAQQHATGGMRTTSSSSALGAAAGAKPGLSWAPSQGGPVVVVPPGGAGADAGGAGPQPQQQLLLARGERHPEAVAVGQVAVDTASRPQLWPPSRARRECEASGRMRPVASWGSLSVLSQQPDAASPSASSSNLQAWVTESLDTAGRGSHGLHMAPSGFGAGLVMGSSEIAAASAAIMATRVGAPLLLIVTDSGHTAAMVAKYKPPMPIMNLVVPRVSTGGLKWQVKGTMVARQCQILRGVTSVLASATAHPSGIVAHGIATARRAGMVTEADEVVAIMRVGGRFAGITVQMMNVGEVLTGNRGGHVLSSAGVLA